MWLPNFHQNAKKILAELLLYSSPTGVRHTIKTEILLTELIALSSYSLDYGLIIKTLTELKKSKRKSLSSFTEQYNACLTEARPLQGKKWTIFLPYNNLLLKKKFKIFNDDYQVIHQKTFKSIVDYDHLLQVVNKTYRYRLETFKLPDLLLKLDTTGRHLSACWNKMQSNFTVLQGIYDFGLYKGLWIQREGPLTGFAHPSWILGQDAQGQLEFHNFLLYGNARPFSSPYKVRPAINLLNKAQTVPKPNSTKSLLFDALRLYAQAMEAEHRYNSFLSFWQLLERLCVADLHGGNTREVIKRLDLILRESKPLDFSIEGLYKSLSGKRNDIVHNGINNIHERDVNILKLLSETAIEWLLQKEKGLTTKNHINEYFILLTRNDRDKQAILETINYIKSSKRSHP